MCKASLVGLGYVEAVAGEWCGGSVAIRGRAAKIMTVSIDTVFQKIKINIQPLASQTNFLPPLSEISSIKIEYTDTNDTIAEKDYTTVPIVNSAALGSGGVPDAGSSSSGLSAGDTAGLVRSSHQHDVCCAGVVAMPWCVDLLTQTLSHGRV